MKENAKTLTCFFHSRDDSPKPAPSTSSDSELEGNKPPGQTSHESASTSEMLISIEGPKLEDTKSSAVTHLASTEFCSRHERQKFH